MIRSAMLVLLVLAATTVAQDDPEAPEAPKVPERVDPAKYPGEAAVILRWEHHFVLEVDGAVRRREKQWIQILDRRAIRGLADPRIDFHATEDVVTIHAARTHLPDGTVLPVPDYSYNLAAPNDVAGWPEWAEWRQKIVSFSGLRVGAIIEFDREVRTKGGVLPWLSAEVRLDADHPVLWHGVTLETPPGTYVNRTEKHDFLTGSTGMVKPDFYLWEAHNLPSGRGEPQSRPWRERCPVVVFTTCPDHPDWVRHITGAVEAASGDPSAGPMADLAAKAAEDLHVPKERVNAVIRRLRDTTHFLGSWKAWRSRSLRPANRVFRSAYASPLEYAAVALSLVRSLGYETTLAVATERIDRWQGMITPADESFASVVLLVKAPGGELLVHPRNGVFRKGHGFGGHTLLEIGPERPSSTGRVWKLTSRGEEGVSDLAVTGLLKLDDKGKLAGALTMTLGPVFFDPDGLRSAGAQKSFCETMVRRLIPDLDVKSHAVRALSTGSLTVAVEVVGKKAFPVVDGLRLLPLGAEPLALTSVPIPLAEANRRTDVVLAGAFRESVDVRIKLPEGAEAVIRPPAVAEDESPWGRFSAGFEVDGRTVRLSRRLSVVKSRLTPAELAEVRLAVRTLYAPGANLLGIATK